LGYLWASQPLTCFSNFLSIFRFRNSDLHDRIDNLHDRIGDLHYRICDLHDRISDLHDRISDLHDRISDLHYRIGNLHYRIGDLHYRISDLHYRISDLHYRIGNLHDRIRDLHYRISDLHYRIDNIQRALNNIFQARIPLLIKEGYLPLEKNSTRETTKSNEMNFRQQYDTKNINWDEVVNILQLVGMGYRTSEVHERAFNNSHSVVFIFADETLVGFGRAISDREYQAAIYDVAVLPIYQGQGIGKMIIQTIVNKTPQCNFILYASPGKEQFYEKEGFRRMKTGMALFANKEHMQERGFTE